MLLEVVATDDAVAAATQVLDALCGAPAEPHAFAIARAGTDECGDLRIETQVLTFTPRSAMVRHLAQLVAAHRPARAVPLTAMTHG